MKKIIIKILVVLLVVLGAVYLYFVLALNNKEKEFKEFKKKIERDSVDYNLRKADSNKVKE